MILHRYISYIEDRQGFFEFAYGIGGMCACVPFMKFGILGNPFLFRYEECYINQWTPLIDVDNVASHFVPVYLYSADILGYSLSKCSRSNISYKQNSLIYGFDEFDD